MEPLLYFANELDRDRVRALRIMCNGVEGHEDIGLTAHVLNCMGNARREGEPVYLLRRDLYVSQVTILTAADQCGPDHGDGLLTFEMVVIPSDNTRRTDNNVGIS